MKIIALALLVQGCLSRPVTRDHWETCFYNCIPERLVEACDHVIKGKGCKCEDGEVIWLDEITDFDY